MTARLGFLGVGWIGRHRMEKMLETGGVEAVAIGDPSPEMAEAAQKLAPRAKLVDGLDGLLDTGVDGIVIATPSALHAEQSIRALEAVPVPPAGSRGRRGIRRRRATRAN